MRYSKYKPQQMYQSESFKDLAIVPLAMRARHDLLLDKQQEQLDIFNNTEVLDNDEARAYYDKKKTELEERVKGLSNQLNTSGSGDTALISEFRNMKKDFNKEISATGSIGALSNARADLNQKKEAYFKYGVSQQQPIAAIENNWKIEEAKWMGSNDFTKLGTDQFRTSAIDMPLAPKNIDQTDLILKAKQFLGNNSTETVNQNTTIENGMLVVRGDSKLDANNLNQLKDFVKYHNLLLDDPNSEYMADQRYKNHGVSDDILKSRFREKLDAISGQAKIIKNTKSETLNAKPLSDGSGGRGEKVTEEENPGLKVSYAPSGKQIVKSKQGLASIVPELAEIEAKEMAGTATDEDAYRKQNLVTLQNGIDNVENDATGRAELVKRAKEAGFDYFKEKQKVKDLYIQKERLLNPKFTGDNKNDVTVYNEAVLENIKYRNDKKNDAGFVDDKYYKMIMNESMGKVLKESDPNRRRKAFEMALMDAGGAPPGHFIERKIGDLDKKIDSVFQNVSTDETLKFSRLYSFSPGEDENKMTDTLNKWATNDAMGILSVAENSGGSFTLLNDDNIYQTKTNAGDNSKFEEIKKARENQNLTMEVRGFVDSGNDGPPQIIFEYTNEKTKQKGQLRVNYDESSSQNKLDDLLALIHEKGNAHTKNVVGSIMDNKKYSKLAPIRLIDLTKNPSIAYDKKTDEFIKARSKEIKDTQMNNEDLKNISFIKPNEKHILVQRRDGFYEMAGTSNEGKTLNARSLSFGNFLDSNFSKASYASGDYSENGKTYRNLPKRYNGAETITQMERVVKNMMEVIALAEQDLITIGLGDEDSRRFKNSAASTRQLIKDAKTREQQYDAVVKFADDYKNSTFATVSKKNLMQ